MTTFLAPDDKTPNIESLGLVRVREIKIPDYNKIIKMIVHKDSLYVLYAHESHTSQRYLCEYDKHNFKPKNYYSNNNDNDNECSTICDFTVTDDYIFIMDVRIIKILDRETYDLKKHIIASSADKNKLNGDYDFMYTLSSISMSKDMLFISYIFPSKTLSLRIDEIFKSPDIYSYSVDFESTEPVIHSLPQHLNIYADNEKLYVTNRTSGFFCYDHETMKMLYYKNRYSYNAEAEDHKKNVLEDDEYIYRFEHMVIQGDHIIIPNRMTSMIHIMDKNTLSHVKKFSIDTTVMVMCADNTNIYTCDFRDLSVYEYI